MNDILPDFINGTFKTVANASIITDTDMVNKLRINEEFARAGINDRWDLFPLFSVLVSTGFNKNLDVFDCQEVYAARHTPKNKPLNIQHEQENIVGHMYDAIAVDKEYNPIPEEPSVIIPNKMHIITASYLYKFWERPERQKQIAEILDEIAAGNWFVSMECLFKNFDFVLAGEDGAQRLLARSSDTAHLTKYLRQYGGSGKYGQYTIGRLLRDITFSAVGLVKNPANPESVISNNLNLFNSAAEILNLGYINLDQLTQEIPMAETLAAEIKTFDITAHPEYKALANKLDAATAKLAEVDKAHVDELKKALAEKDAELEKKCEAEKDAEKEKEEMAKCAKEQAEELDNVKAQLAKVTAECESERKTRMAYEEASRASKRTQAFVDANIEKTEAVKLAEKFKDLSDSAFASMVEIVSNYSKRTPKTVTAEKVVASTETVEASPPLGATSENSLELTRAHVKEWLKGKKGS